MGSFCSNEVKSIIWNFLDIACVFGPLYNPWQTTMNKTIMNGANHYWHNANDNFVWFDHHNFNPFMSFFLSFFLFFLVNIGTKTILKPTFHVWDSLKFNIKYELDLQHIPLEIQYQNTEVRGSHIVESNN